MRKRKTVDRFRYKLSLLKHDFPHTPSRHIYGLPVVVPSLQVHCVVVPVHCVVVTLSWVFVPNLYGTFELEEWKLAKLSAKQYIMPADPPFSNIIQDGGRRLGRISVSLCPRTRGFSNIGKCMQAVISRKENIFFITSELEPSPPPFSTIVHVQYL